MLRSDRQGVPPLPSGKQATQHSAAWQLFGQVGIFLLPHFLLLLSVPFLGRVLGLLLALTRFEPDDKAAVTKTAGKPAAKLADKSTRASVTVQGPVCVG